MYSKYLGRRTHESKEKSKESKEVTLFCTDSFEFVPIVVNLKGVVPKTINKGLRWGQPNG